MNTTPFRALHQVATHPLMVVAIFLLTVFQQGHTIFAVARGLGNMAEVDWIDLLVKGALCAVILVLQHMVRTMQRTARMRRIVDAALHRYRAELMYTHGIRFTQDGGRAQHITQAMQQEAQAVMAHVLHTHPHLTPAAVRHFLEENYGTAAPA